MQGNVEIDKQALRNNLRRLREAKGYSQKQVAEAAGISVPGYQKLEQAQAIPRRETLAAVAQALGTTIPSLLRPVEFPTTVRFRAAKKLRTREQVLARVANWLTDYRNLEEILDIEPRNPIEEVSLEVSLLEPRESRPLKAAELIREKWGLKQEEPIRNICGLFDSKGIKVLRLPLGGGDDGFFGLSVGAESGGPAVVVNTWERIPVERWIFSAAHELGHLLLHRDAFDVEQQDENKQEEEEANHFASWFLMPMEAFEKEWQGLSGLPWFEAILAIKRIFRVSWKTVVSRLIQTGKATSQAWAQFYMQYKRKYGRGLPGHVEPYPLPATEFSSANVAEEPEGLTNSDFPAYQLESLVRKALESGRITLSRAAEIFRIPLVDMRQRARSWGVEPA